MPCESLDQQTVRLNVSMGALPEGFCPATMQQLGDAIAARLIISSNAAFSSFAIGPLAPTSNVGPWLKDCEEWFVWDSSTASYRPIPKGGFNAFEVFDATTTFTVPPFIYKLMVEGWGGGGGGSNFSETTGTGGGGGGGGFGKTIIDVVPGQSLTLTIGAGGGPGLPSTPGGDTIITGPAGVIMTAGGGTLGDSLNGGGGGVVTGAEFSIQGGSGASQTSQIGIGGSSPQGGAGGIKSFITVRLNGIVPGGGGSGGSSGIGGEVGGSGAHGRVVIWY